MHCLKGFARGGMLKLRFDWYMIFKSFIHSKIFTNLSVFLFFVTTHNEFPSAIFREYLQRGKQTSVTCNNILQFFASGIPDKSLLLE